MGRLSKDEIAFNDVVREAVLADNPKANPADIAQATSITKQVFVALAIKGYYEGNSPDDLDRDKPEDVGLQFCKRMMQYYRRKVVGRAK